MVISLFEVIQSCMLPFPVGCFKIKWLMLVILVWFSCRADVTNDAAQSQRSCVSQKVWERKLCFFISVPPNCFKIYIHSEAWHKKPFHINSLLKFCSKSSVYSYKCFFPAFTRIFLAKVCVYFYWKVMCSFSTSGQRWVCVWSVACLTHDTRTFWWTQNELPAMGYVWKLHKW